MALGSQLTSSQGFSLTEKSMHPQVVGCAQSSCCFRLPHAAADFKTLCRGHTYHSALCLLLRQPYSTSLTRREIRSGVLYLCNPFAISSFDDQFAKNSATCQPSNLLEFTITFLLRCSLRCCHFLRLC